MTGSRLFDRVALGLLSFLAILFLLPVLWWIVVATDDTTSIARDGNALEIWIPSTFALDDNIEVAFADYPIGRFLLNSFVIAMVVTVAELLLASMAGYALAKYEFGGRTTAIGMTLALMIMPQIVLVIPLLELSVDLDLINTYQGLILPFIVTPFGIFMMRQFLLDFPQDYVDAARLDGASELGIFVRIVLPMSRNGLATLGIFTFLFQWEALLWPLVLLSQQDLYTFPVGISLLRSDVLVPFNAIYAVSLLFSLPIIILYLLAQRLVMHSLAMSGLKG